MAGHWHFCDESPRPSSSAFLARNAGSPSLIGCFCLRQCRFRLLRSPVPIFHYVPTLNFQFARFALAIPFFVVVVNIMTKLFENPLMVRRLVIAI